MDEYAPVEIVAERYTERDPHPGGQEAFTIRARLPWHQRLHTSVTIEVTMDEEVLRPAVKRRDEYHRMIEAGILTEACKARVNGPW